MHLHFERVEKPSSYSDCNITSLSWMGKVPETPLQREEEGWKLNRNQYYSDGWLATGNVRGIVGCTFTTCACRNLPTSELPTRTNYNLRGHRAKVTIVKWNEPYQKLATCDASGIIFVWIKYEGRWSIELINDRSTPVTDFCWSHDGRMALICYTDGFVLVGSVTGQRYWSSILNLDSCHTTCGIWTPDDQHVLFGTSKGHVIVIQVNGAVVSEVVIRKGIPIRSMSWSCEKFKMEDGSDPQSVSKNQEFVLAVCFVDGVIYLMKSYDDIFPTVIASRLQSPHMEWSNNGDVLAVAGHVVRDYSPTTGSSQQLNQHQEEQLLVASSSSTSSNSFSNDASTTYTTRRQIGSTGYLHRVNHSIDDGTTCARFLNSINFYTTSGVLRFRTNINFMLHPITALTWGHNDKRIFVATGAVLHIAWISKKVPSLQLLSRLAVFKLIPNEDSVNQLKLPSRVQALVSSLFSRTLRCYLPQMDSLRDFVSKPPAENVRLHCTLIRHDDDLVGGSTTYVLYLEHLGGLVPILKGKRASKLKPEFVIFNPEACNSETHDNKTSQKEQEVTETQSAPQSLFSTPILGRRKTPSHGISSQLYWKTVSNPASGTEDSEDDENSNSNGMTDEYGHIYSLPSPIMRRKCRRKRRGPSQPEADERGTPAGNRTVEHVVAGDENRAVSQNSNNSTGNRNTEGSNRQSESTVCPVEILKPESTYMDEMPESERLILVTSNIWGTKFKILGLSPSLPSCLGIISYRTSVLHLQPRQMTLIIKELGSSRKPSASSLEFKLVNPPAAIKAAERTSAEKDEDSGRDGTAFTSEVSGEFVESYSSPLIAPLTPYSRIRGLSQPASGPTPLYNSQSSGLCHSPPFDRRLDAMTRMSEELLTLQISGKSNLLTMELHHKYPDSQFASSPAHHLLFSPHHRSHPALFHSMPSSHGVHESETSDRLTTRQAHGSRLNNGFSRHVDDDEYRSEDMIAQMARQLAEELRMRHVEATSPPPASVSTRISSPNVPLLTSSSSSVVQSVQSNQYTLPSASSSSRLNCGTVTTGNIKALNGHRCLQPSEQPQQQTYSPRHSFNGQSLFSASHKIESLISQTRRDLTSMRTHTIESNEIINSMLPPHVVHSNGPLGTGSIVNSCDITFTRSGVQSNRLKSPYRRTASDLLQVNGRQSSLHSSSHSSLRPTGSSLVNDNQSTEELLFSDSRRHDLVSRLHEHPSALTSFGIRKNDESGESSVTVCAPHQQNVRSFVPRDPFPLSPSSTMITGHDSVMTNSIPGPTVRAGRSSNDLDHSDFRNVRRTRSGSTPSSCAESSRRLTLRPQFLRQEVLSSERASLTGPSFNCTELDGIDPCLMEDCLSCDCDKECTQTVQTSSPPPSSSLALNACSEALSYEPIQVEQHVISCEGNNSSSDVELRNLNKLLSTPVHRAKKKRSQVEYKTYENIWNEESAAALSSSTTTGVSSVSAGRIHGEVLISPSLIEIASDSDRWDYRRSQKQQQQQLQLHHHPISSSDHRRPSYHSQSSIASDAERIPSLTGVNLRLLRSNSANSSSSNDSDRIHSLPASPAQRRRAFGRSILNSPLMLRRVLKQKLNQLDCSSEEDDASETDDSEGMSRDLLQSFQRSKIQQKLHRKGLSCGTRSKPRRGSRVQPENEGPKVQEDHLREYILQNKAPFWNELSQVYQLDFGGRVTQESAKNFQIEHQTNQVMQFGRIDGNAYTLDFQYPFCALQALAVALANVTQRLK